MSSEPERPSRRTGGLNLALVLILCLIVARTLILDRETAQERETSEAVTGALEALSFTKLSYSPDLIIGAAGKSGPTVKDAFETGATERKQDVKVTDGWRKLAMAHAGRAAEWRRLGITLALFHLKGVMDALRHVADHFPPPKTAAIKGHIPRGSVDPFGHRPTPVPPTEEIAMWEGIYGRRPLTPAQTVRFRRMLGQLQLGWFENVAAAQLYARAGQRDQARVAAEAAAQSAETLSRLQELDVATIGFGSIGLLMVGLIGLANLIQRAATGQASGTTPMPNAWPDSNGTVAIPPSYPPSPINQAVDARRQLLFPYALLLLAFITYLLAHEGISLLASLAVSPFRDRLEAMSVTQLLRLELLLQICAYVPILGLPLWLLHRRVRFYPLTGTPLTVRRLLSYIGFRINNPIADLGAGTIGYLCVAPVVFLATVVSNWLFARFHTPQNPAALEMLAAQHNLDRFLVLFVASVAAPFAEETMFRGILYSALRTRLGVWGGAALSGAIFSLVHPTLPGGFLPIMMVGMGLAFVYEWRKSLLPGMVLHGLYNGLITLITFAIFAK
jgi:membrane protease YdiL (CAAX protease family)